MLCSGIRNRQGCFCVCCISFPRCLLGWGRGPFLPWCALGDQGLSFLLLLGTLDALCVFHVVTNDGLFLRLWEQLEISRSHCLCVCLQVNDIVVRWTNLRQTEFWSANHGHHGIVLTAGDFALHVHGHDIWIVSAIIHGFQEHCAVVGVYAWLQTTGLNRIERLLCVRRSAASLHAAALDLDGTDVLEDGHAEGFGANAKLVADQLKECSFVHDLCGSDQQVLADRSDALLQSPNNRAFADPVALACKLHNGAEAHFRWRRSSHDVVLTGHILQVRHGVGGQSTDDARVIRSANNRFGFTTSHHVVFNDFTGSIVDGLAFQVGSKRDDPLGLTHYAEVVLFAASDVVVCPLWIQHLRN
uniref:Uncharacterized protein n=1 Tax=uncultured marine virus TaxID=186617 RepID=A0A0F7L070_9VIRU|nr:hypothetical protein [uncultured marine virus]